MQERRRRDRRQAALDSPTAIELRHGRSAAHCAAVTVVPYEIRRC